MPDSPASLPRPRFCYLEIPAVDPARSAAFYEAVFGWAIRGRGGARPAFDDATGSVSGAWVTGRPPAREPGFLPYIWVDDIEAALEAAAGQGAEIVEPAHRDAEPDGEWVATFRDPDGNLLGLYQEGPRREGAGPEGRPAA